MTLTLLPQRPQALSLFHKALSPWSMGPSLVKLRSNLLLGRGSVWETPEGPWAGSIAQ